MFRHFSVSRFWCGRAQCKYRPKWQGVCVPKGCSFPELSLLLPTSPFFTCWFCVPSLFFGIGLFSAARARRKVPSIVGHAPCPPAHYLLGLFLPAPARIMLRQCKYYCTKPMPQSSEQPSGFSLFLSLSLSLCVWTCGRGTCRVWIVKSVTATAAVAAVAAAAARSEYVTIQSN